MKLYVGVTDDNWYRFLAERPDIDELNFWQPSGSRNFAVIQPGDLFLFKLHSPLNFIAGGGIFTHFTRCPIELAWEAFGEKNGVATYDGMRRRVAGYRRVAPDSRESFVIGCIMLRDPFFFPQEQWIPSPADFSRNIVQGKSYDASTGTGKDLYAAVQERLANRTTPEEISETPDGQGILWSDPRMVRSRLGQGSFRMLVTDTYERRCAVTQEKALPVLQAAHIKPVTQQGEHRIDNGLLLRSDVHTLFDSGYLTITPEHKIEVSKRLHEDFDDGEHYYQLGGSEIWLPPNDRDRPRRDFLEWHADTVFLG